MSGRSKKINGLPEFSGPFADLIVQYIQYKRAQGYVLHDPIVYRLREMDFLFRDMEVKEPKITREMYEAYTRPKPLEKETTTQKRQAAIRGFAKYLVSLGYEGIYTGFDDTRIFKRDFIPYVFSRAECRSMFSALDSECLESPGYESDCFRMSMIMYYCFGLRKSEAQNLMAKDVDLDSGKVTILHGKNDVSRIVVASESVLCEMKAYAEKYVRTSGNDTFFLYPDSSRGQCERRIYDRYHKLLAEASIPPKPDGGRQRLHDLRHTFCVRALEQMQGKGFDLYTSLPLLSKYLGHKHITETEYYLRLMEEHFGGILDKTEAYRPSLYRRERGEGDE